MTIQKDSQLTFEGLTYNVEDRDRVAAQLVNENANTFSKKNTFNAGAHWNSAAPTFNDWVGSQVSESILPVSNSIADRISVLPNPKGGATNYVNLPTAKVIGESYRFVHGVTSAYTSSIVFKSDSADGLTFTGGILSVDEDDTTDTTDINVKYPGGDDDQLTIKSGSGFDLTFTATTTTNYCVSGWASSTNTHAAFGDQA
jgi:hypothetical protein